MPGAPAASVRRSPSFLWLWGGQTVSVFGEQFTGLAVPVLAVTLLHAVAWQMGVLGAASTAAFLIVGLPAGAWVDRWMKRRVLILADVVRAVALALVPILWFAGVLQIWHLIVIVAIVGVASVFFDVSYQSYIPLLVQPTQVGSANSTLEATAQVARIGGPGLAGALLTVVSAPVLLIADAISYLVSVLSLLRVRDHEVPADPTLRQPLHREIADGVRFVWGQPLIRSISATTATSNFFSTLAQTIYPLYALRELGIGSLGFGITLSAGAVGGLLGAVATPRLARWIGEGRVIVVSAIAYGLVFILVPVASLLHGPAAVVVLSAGEFVTGFMVLVYNITQVTMRQRLCPPRLLGRMNASIRCFVWGVMPIAALISGAIAGGIGLVPTLWIAFAGGLGAAVFVLFSPLTGMRVLPTELDAQAQVTPEPESGAPGEPTPEGPGPSDPAPSAD
ncbi:MFS transporter [Galbitalea soli]|uniref:MFS transporter n=2 Tax=Galbitalea soli TaxID=1268042 RepID=A0A7C9PMB2_9MICO|nr:MFS transporter [Galbitalea soli]